jgi:hypothetical protein
MNCLQRKALKFDSKQQFIDYKELKNMHLVELHARCIKEAECRIIEHATSVKLLQKHGNRAR